MSSVGYYEPVDELSAATRDTHRAIIEHNRDEEKAHATMLIESIRRRDMGFAKELKERLFTDTPIVDE